jgi:exodeoxyribonuclease VII small subunit
MSDDRTTFEQTKARLEEILEQVRRKDTSLEQSLELLEEGVRLANRCNELIDQTNWRAGEVSDAPEQGDEPAGEPVDSGSTDAPTDEPEASDDIPSSGGDAAHDDVEETPGRALENGPANDEEPVPEAQDVPDDERA